MLTISPFLDQNYITRYFCSICNSQTNECLTGFAADEIILAETRRKLQQIWDDHQIVTRPPTEGIPWSWWEFVPHPATPPPAQQSL